MRSLTISLSNAKPQSENHFIKEWNETEFYLPMSAKITHSNKPCIYIYWLNPDNYSVTSSSPGVQSGILSYSILEFTFG